MLNNKLLTNSIILFSTLFVVAIFLYGFGLEFFYDDFITLKNYSSDELKDSLTNSWSLDRLENPGYRPLFNYVFHFMWINFGSNYYLYNLIQIILILVQGFLIFNILKLYNKDKLFAYLFTLLILIFSDQFSWRIFIVEIPSLLSSVILLIGIFSIFKYFSFFWLIISYFCFFIACLIKETNFLFIFTPLIVTVFNKDNFSLKSTIIQSISLILFSIGFLSIRSNALTQVPQVLLSNNILSFRRTVDLLIDFILQFSPSLGLDRFSGFVIIFIFSLFIIHNIYKEKLSAFIFSFNDISTLNKILISLFILSMGSFPFYSAGRLRGLFVILLGAIVISALNQIKIKKGIIIATLSGLILINGLNDVSITRRYKRQKNNNSTMIYFNPIYRSSINRGNAISLLKYLDERFVKKSRIKSYNKMISTLPLSTNNVKKYKEFEDEHGIAFIELKVNDNESIKIMKYEFSEKFLKGFSNLYYLQGIPDMPIQGAWRNQVLNFIKYFNLLSTEYTYRLPTSKEYYLASGDFSPIYNTPIQSFKCNNIDIVQNTLPNQYDIYGLYSNVNEWTADDLDEEFSYLYGGDAHFGAHNILFVDQSQHADGHHTKFYGFRLIAVEK